MRYRVLLATIGCIAMCATGCESTGSEKSSSEPTEEKAAETDDSPDSDKSAAQQRPDDGGPVQVDAGEGLAVATFAGGCFWCMEPPYEKLEGVKSVVSGFCGGNKRDPKYREVAMGQTQYTETVQITYDPDKISYAKLLDVYWRNIDPTDAEGQFVDRGSQYRPVIFYHDERQRRLAEESKRELEENGPFEEPIVVEIVPATRFWAAKEKHQDFYKTHTERYKSYRKNSGRDEFIERHWD